MKVVTRWWDVLFSYGAPCEWLGRIPLVSCLKGKDGDFNSIIQCNLLYPFLYD